MTGIGTSGQGPVGLHLATRLDVDLSPNALAQAARRRPEGLINLADTNPTHWGLADEDALTELAAETAAAHPYDPAPRGPGPARAALAAAYGGTADDYLVASSTSELYGWLLTLLCDPGDEIAVPSPGYPLLDALARLHDVRLRPYELHYAHPDGWFADPGQLAALAASPRVRAAVVVSPGNPTGSYLRASERQTVVAACAAGGAALIADEVFHPFGLETPVPPRLAGEAGCATFALDGASKSLCLPQAKIGWLRMSGVPDSLRGELWRRLEFIADAALSVSGPAGGALPRLLPHVGAAVERCRTRCADNLRAARRLFGGRESPYRVRTCGGGWTALLEVPRVLPDDRLALAALEAGVEVYPGYFYDSPERGLVALSLLPTGDVFAAGCRRLRDAIDRLR
jgi:aspartate/methionine/tyrosine aminotransferase